MRRLPRPIPVLVAGLALATLAACGPKIRVSDSVDIDFDLRLSRLYDDKLNGPYVAGSDFRVFAYDVTGENDLAGWSIVSRDPAIVEVTSTFVDQDDLDEDDNRDQEDDVIVAEVEAVGPGTAVLEVLDDAGEFVRTIELTVMQPDSLVLRAAGPLFIKDEAISPSLVEAPKLLVGGRATFLVEWFAADQQLAGAGALALSSTHAAADTLDARRTYLDEDRDWATLEFATPDPGDEIAAVEFYANGELVDVVDVELLGPDEVAEIELLARDDSDAKDGQLLPVLAQAFTADGERIWGVAFDWDIDGRIEPGEGDLFRYWFESGTFSMLGAQYGALRGEVRIQGDEGFVDSSNDISCFCSTNHDEPARGVGLGLLSLAALGLVRRRRRELYSGPTPPTPSPIDTVNDPGPDM